MLYGVLTRLGICSLIMKQSVRSDLLRKRVQRITVDIPVTIMSALSSPVDATLANLTEQGAMIVGTTLPKGTPFQMEYMGQIIYGTVMWAEEDRFGARFPMELRDGPLHDRLEHVRAKQGAQHIPATGISAFSTLTRRIGGFGRRGIQ